MIHVISKSDDSSQVIYIYIYDRQKESTYGFARLKYIIMIEYFYQRSSEISATHLCDLLENIHIKNCTIPNASRQFHNIFLRNQDD